MFLRLATRALVLVLVATLLVVAAAQGVMLGMAIAIRDESDIPFGKYFEWLQTPSRWGPVWLVVALCYPAVIATLWYTDLRRSVPAVALALFVTALIGGMAGQHGGCWIIGMLPFVGLGTMIWSARRCGKEPISRSAPAGDGADAPRSPA